MHFYNYISSQLKLHPSMKPQDFVKLCYQAAFGAEHLLADTERAKSYLLSEYHSATGEPGTLYERISPNVCRINLSAWKHTGMPIEWLFQMFVASSSDFEKKDTKFLEYLEIIELNLHELPVSFTLSDWKSYLDTYMKEGIHAVHHSEAYRAAERPAYRIVNSRFTRLIPLLQKAHQLSKQKPNVVIAIDGRAASGKSTIADDLHLILGAGIIHMDDFFLPLELRTTERFQEPGGNVHYERFAKDVLPHVSSREEFHYPIFDCGIMDYKGHRTVSASPWKIVEGAYSHHPYFGRYADLKVFSDISPEEQLLRISKRNGKEMAERFHTEWIPLEERYFRYCKIRENAEIVIS